MFDEKGGRWLREGMEDVRGSVRRRQQESSVLPTKLAESFGRGSRARDNEQPIKSINKTTPRRCTPHSTGMPDSAAGCVQARSQRNRKAYRRFVVAPSCCTQDPALPTPSGHMQQ